MATHTIETGSVHNVLNWERRLEREALKRMKFTSFWGREATAGIRVVDDLKRGNDAAGDTVYTTLEMNLTGDGVSGDNQLQGNEEDLVLHRQTLIIDQLRNGVKTAGDMTNQRTFINFKEEARGVLQKWMADRFDLWAANQLAGNTGESEVKRTGMQATSAPTSATGNMRIIYGPGDDTTEASLSVTSTAKFQLTMLDDAILIAETSTPAIQPMDTPTGPKFVAVLHPIQIRDLKTDATAARVTWYDYNKAIIQGGGEDKIGNPAWGALGEYNGVLIHSDSRMPTAPSTTRVKRGVFFGAQAGTAAFGREGGSQNRFKFATQKEDYDNRFGIAVKTMSGMKKTVYNSIDHATIVLSSYASA
jgi:N4-gp56 family major capsid protein